MPSSKRPRKAYKPKAIGRPVMQGMRRDLILPAYSALSILQLSADAEALESARHTLAALYNYMGVARRAPEIIAGLDAIVAMDERQKRTGTYRPTGGELQVLRDAVVVCDALLPVLRTDRLTEACVAVDRALFGGGV